MTDNERIIGCGTEEMKQIQWQLKKADNKLMNAEALAMGDAELGENILVVRRLLNDLIRRLD